MCHVVRKSAVTQSCQLRFFWSRRRGCWSRGDRGGSRSYGSLYDEDVLLAIVFCGRQDMRQFVSRDRAGRCGGGLTELCGCQNPFVEDDNAGAAGNPDTVRESISQYRSPTCRAEPIIAVTASATTDNTTRSRTWGFVGRGAGVPEGQHVRDVDGRVKAAGLGGRRSGFLSKDTALELPLLLARVPLVFLCCRHGGCDVRDFGRHVESSRW